jgi:DNA-binding transcriptional MerR regulator
MPTTPATLPTVGAIARRLGESVHRIEYMIRSRSIRPTSRAGHVRIFSEADVARIAVELQLIDIRQEIAAEAI